MTFDIVITNTNGAVVPFEGFEFILTFPNSHAQDRN